MLTKVEWIQIKAAMEIYDSALEFDSNKFMDFLKTYVEVEEEKIKSNMDITYPIMTPPHAPPFDWSSVPEDSTIKATERRSYGLFDSKNVSIGAQMDSTSEEYKQYMKDSNPIYPQKISEK